MKLILIVCTVLSVSLLTNGLPIEGDDEDLDLYVDLFDKQLADQLINDQQISCILDGILRVVDNNQDLKWWYNEIEKTALKMLDKGTKCATLSGLRQDLCLVKLGVEVKREYKRIRDAIPKDKKDLFLKAIKDAVFGCFP